MCESNVLISIILPTYNGSKYIDCAIKSCLAQSFPHYELIIVDDGSTDNTYDILRKYEKHPKVIVLRHSKNMNLPTALNSGILHARGEYITWHSDDNYFHKDALKILYDYLINNDIDMVYSDYRIVDEKGKILGIHVSKEYDNIIFCDVIGPSFLYKKNITNVIGLYNTKMFYLEDYEYWLRVASKYKIACNHKVLYSYRVHKNMLSARKDHLIQRKYIKIKYKHIKNVKRVSNIKKADAYKLIAYESYNNKLFLMALLSSFYFIYYRVIHIFMIILKGISKYLLKANA